MLSAKRTTTVASEANSSPERIFGYRGGCELGSVRFRKDRGFWFIDYVAVDGRRMRETIGSDKRLARKVLAQREAEVQLGIHRLPTAQTLRFADAATDWLNRRPGLRPSTVESYEDALDRLTPAFGEKRIGAITRHDIERWLTSAHVARPRPGQRKAPYPLSRTTVNYTLHVLKFVFADAMDHGLISENPAAKIKPLRRDGDVDGGAVRFLKLDEITKLLDTVEGSWRTLYLIAIHTGLRRGELLGLKWGDVSLEKRLLHVRRSLNRDGEAPLKTRDSRPTVDFSDAVKDALLDLTRSDDPEEDHVFLSSAGGPIDPDNVDRAFKRHLTLAGLPDIRFHDLRHTHASLLIAAGVHPKAIQAHLGHASITTTLNTYGHLMPNAFEGVALRLEAVLALAARQVPETIQEAQPTSR